MRAPEIVFDESCCANASVFSTAIHYNSGASSGPRGNGRNSVAGPAGQTLLSVRNDFVLYCCVARDKTERYSKRKEKSPMAATPSFPYETRLNILHKSLEVIDEKALADACEYRWYNQTLCKVNDSVVRLGVIEGEYHWHKHDEDDEFFYVVDGQLLIDLEDRTVELSPRQGFVVPKGVTHRTRAPRRSVILMVENAGIIPTGS
jgi:mannose-6-phosphate isomerase-like protein (cupin superfamily)